MRLKAGWARAVKNRHVMHFIFTDQLSELEGCMLLLRCSDKWDLQFARFKNWKAFKNLLAVSQQFESKTIVKFLSIKVLWPDYLTNTRKDIGHSVGKDMWSSHDICGGSGDFLNEWMNECRWFKLGLFFMRSPSLDGDGEKMRERKCKLLDIRWTSLVFATGLEWWIATERIQETPENITLLNLDHQISNTR